MTNSPPELTAPIEDETRCTEFTSQHGLANPPADTTCFAFVCPTCEHTNPLTGEPDEFREQPVRCMQCTAVVVLDGTALNQFAEGVRACD